MALISLKSFLNGVGDDRETYQKSGNERGRRNWIMSKATDNPLDVSRNKGRGWKKKAEKVCGFLIAFLVISNTI